LQAHFPGKRTRKTKGGTNIGQREKGQEPKERDGTEESGQTKEGLEKNNISYCCQTGTFRSSERDREERKKSQPFCPFLFLSCLFISFLNSQFP